MAKSIIATVMAGGFGTRLQGVLKDLPKPMAPVAGKPFLEWVLRYLRRQGVSSSILSTGYLAETISSYFESNPPAAMECQCAPETSPLGTAGGFLNAVNQTDLENPPLAWLVLNGDSLALADLGPLFAQLEDPKVDGAVLSVWMEDASRYGSLQVSSDDRLESFLEKRPGASWINAGVYLIRHSLIERFPQKAPLSWETDVFPTLLSEGAHFSVVRQSAAFIDIGLPESLAQADDFVRQHESAF